MTSKIGTRQGIANPVKRVVRVSVETVRIVAGLPALQEFQADQAA